MALILIVEDEKLLRWALTEQLKRTGHRVHPAGNLAEAVEFIEGHQPDVVLLDLALPDGHGLDFFQRNQERLEHTVVIIMTAVGQVEEAVRAMKLGAFDFLNKPVDQEELVALIERSLSARDERLEVQAARQVRERNLAQTLIAESPVFKECVEVAEEVARSEVSSILLQGESGTGKNVIARHMHAISSRRRKPLLEISCAAIPDQLLESELFGHERGAFTDAKATRRGTFELADGGTVVLDEIGELKLELQAKLLHVLEDRRLHRVGSGREIFVDVRVIALTNRNLTAMVGDGRFRNDLYYRLNVFPITVPPLRDRPEDVLPLTRYFLSVLEPKFGRSFVGITREAENLLLAYPWPGNVRELRNVVERAMILERGDRLGPAALILDTAAAVGGPMPAEPGSTGPAPDAAFASLEEMERQMVARAMRSAGDNQTRAAELLGITRDQLRYRLKKFDLPPPDSAGSD